MRTLERLCLFACIIAGCGDDDAITADTQTGNHPPPRVIAGGGIGDGPIDGVVNLYVMDDITRAPISGATVRVGTLDGMTDATGLFIAEGVVGPQTVIAKVASYRSEMWVGANGANMTMSLQLATAPTTTQQANLTGSITGFDSLTVPSGHFKAAWVSYSQDDKAGDGANNITTANNMNICDVPTGGCSFTVTTRTGQVALLAVIYDHDTKSTATPADDTFTVIGWASRQGISVQSGVDQTGVTLAMVDVGNLANVTVDFGTPPTGMQNVAAIVGIEVPGSGTMQLIPQFLTPSAATVLAPKLSAFSGSTYRLTGLANNGSEDTSAASVKLLRGQTSTTLAAGAWLGAPSSVTLTRNGGSWLPASGALVHGVEYDVAADDTKLLSITAFDGSTSVAVPDLLALPASPLIARVTALQGALDLTSFSADDDFAKVTGFSAQPVSID